MSTAIHRMVEAYRASNYPALIARMPSGWAVIGNSQFLLGYSLLLPDPDQKVTSFFGYLAGGIAGGM